MNKGIKLYKDDCLKVLKNIESESIDCIVTDCPYIVGGGHMVIENGQAKVISNKRYETRMKKMKLLNNDCLEEMKKIEDESIDLVATDCPYHIVNGGCTTNKFTLKSHEPSGIFNKRYNEKIVNAKGRTVNVINGTKHINLNGIFNELDPMTYTRQGKLFKHNDIKFSEWLPDVYRVLKKGTHCYIMINARNLNELTNEALKVGFVFQQIIIWNKGNSTPNKYYLNSYEMILMLSKRPARDINEMGTKNILTFDNIIGDKLHPTEKPTELMEVLIRNSTNEGDIVLDPFMGVGATGVASKKLGRDFIGIEIDEKYYDIAYKRIMEDVKREELTHKPKKEKIIKNNELNIFNFLEA